jgi:hypothetical protein
MIFSDVMEGWYRAKQTFNATPEANAMPNQWSMRIEEFLRSGEIISLRYFIYWYGTGAAHPNTNIRSVNLGGPLIGPFGLRELFDDESEAMKFLLPYCELDLRRQHADEAEFEFLFYPKSDTEGWETFMHFNFDEKGLTINLSPYDVLAYSFGPQEIHIPWGMIEGKIALMFRDGPLREIIDSATAVA